MPSTTNDNVGFKSSFLPTSTSVEPGTFCQAVQTNMKRTVALVEGEDTLEELEARVKRLRTEVANRQKEHRKIQVLASLKLVGRASTWEEIGGNDEDSDEEEEAEDGPMRWQKEYIIAILSSTANEGRLPDSLCEDKWEGYLSKINHRGMPQFKKTLCLDPEVFLVRSRRAEFAKFHTPGTLYKWFAAFESHYQYERDRENRAGYEQLEACMAAIVSSFPAAFKNCYYDYKQVGWLCRSSTIAQAALASPNAQQIFGEEGFEFFDRLDSTLKNQHELMLKFAEKFPGKGASVACKYFADAQVFAMDLVSLLGFNIGDKLKEFSSKIQDNYSVAEAFCNANGRSYPYVSYRIRKHSEQLVRLACKTFPSVLLQRVPRDIERKLVRDKEFILSILNNKEHPPPPNLYSILHRTLRVDGDICLAAVLSGNINLDPVPDAIRRSASFCSALVQSPSFVMSSLVHFGNNPQPVSLSQKLGVDLALRGVEQYRSIALEALSGEFLTVGDLPTVWACDKSFWGDALSRNSSLWELCPFNDDVDFVKSLGPPDDSLMASILAFFPSLASDLDYWRAIVTHWDSDWDLEAYLLVFPKNVVYQDKQTMLLAVKQERRIYGHLPAGLKEDRDVVRALIESRDERALFSMPLTVREKYPDLVVEAFELLPANVETLDEVYNELIERDEWNNRDLGLAWLSKGGGWLQDFPDDFANDRDIMLLVGEHDEPSFHEVSNKLLTDKQFLLEAVAKNGMIYRNIDNELNRDFDVVLAAWATSKAIGDIFFAREDHKYVTEFAGQVRAKLHAHDIFFKTILCGAASLKNNTCPLRELLVGLGNETSLSFRKRLAELLDIATGAKLGRLRKASSHLQAWGY